MQKRLDFVALFLYCLLIYWLSDQQYLPTPELFANEDKLHHFLAYFGMGVLTWRAFSHLLTRYEVLFLASLIFCSFYGLSDEWHQSFVIGRNSSAADWLADTIGGFLGTFASYWYTLRKLKIRSV